MEHGNIPPAERSRHYHPHKRQLVGSKPGRAPPAWKTNAAGTSGQLNGTSGKVKTSAETGSKIFISMLPVDVVEKEVEDLFRLTVGPLKESFMVYNSQGKSKGMAVVSFQRPGDAAVARTKYNGKMIDGRRPIKIEIISDGLPIATPNQPSLLDRIATNSQPLQPLQVQKPVVVNPFMMSVPPSAPKQLRKALISQPAQVAAPTLPPRRVKQRKGPKRLKKRVVTVDDLDKEMEDYRAAAPTFAE